MRVGSLYKEQNETTSACEDTDNMYATIFAVRRSFNICLRTVYFALCVEWVWDWCLSISGLIVFLHSRGAHTLCYLFGQVG